MVANVWPNLYMFVGQHISDLNTSADTVSLLCKSSMRCGKRIAGMFGKILKIMVHMYLALDSCSASGLLWEWITWKSSMIHKISDSSLVALSISFVIKCSSCLCLDSCSNLSDCYNYFLIVVLCQELLGSCFWALNKQPDLFVGNCLTGSNQYTVLYIMLTVIFLFRSFLFSDLRGMETDDRILSKMVLVPEIMQNFLNSSGLQVHGSWFTWKWLCILELKHPIFSFRSVIKEIDAWYWIKIL